MNKQKKQFFIVLVLFVLIDNYAFAACTGSSPTWSCTYDSTSTQIQSCIDGATAGDTINIGAGTSTWNTNIVITKAVNIIGAGIGQTIINSTYTHDFSSELDTNSWLISIVPATPSDNPTIRISGMTINFGTGSTGILYWNTDYTAPVSECTNVRFDHLSLYSPINYLFYRYGAAYGVMDNCIINGRINMGGEEELWTVSSYEFGTGSNFYFEDNTFTVESSSTVEMCAGNGANRYAWRYNTITTPTNVRTYPIFDLHGNQNSVRASCFGAEIYNNTIIANYDNSYTTAFIRQRGGKALVFNNTITWTTSGGLSAFVLEEHDDSEGPGAATNAINGQPQHVSDSYYFGNTKNGSRLDVTEDSDCCSAIDINSEFWNENDSFNGTTGIGIGLVSGRPITCSVGVGYWDTNENKLYRCESNNIWTAYYTPYTYPHPLRGTFKGATIINTVGGLNAIDIVGGLNVINQ